MRLAFKLFSCFLVVAALGFSQTAPPTAGLELSDAVKAGDLAKVMAIVEKDPRIVNIPNPNGETIIFGALVERRAEIVEYLISKGADVNVQNNFHMAPLHIACVRGLPLGLVKLLVEKGADVNAVSKYQGKPLDLADESGDEAVVRYLTSKGARYTPLDFETIKLSSNLHRIAFPWGMRNNLIVFGGSDGLLVIDTGFSKRALEAFKKTVSGFAKGDIQYVVNTHSDWDHTAGNAGLAPSEAAVIDAGRLDNEDLKSILAKSDKPMTGRSGRILPAPYMMKFNGETIDLIPYPGLHSQVDMMIFFPKPGVVCMGDLLLSQSCPAVRDAGGYLEFLDKVLDVFPAGTMFISGHGRDLTAVGVKKYRDDIAAMFEIVKKEYTAGKTVEDMIGADVLKAYKADYSHLDWLGPDSWIRRIVRSLATGSTK
jgi:glyoxylase-like metal-dependent hydrolase (beta-lactamase superfamily II)